MKFLHTFFELKEGIKMFENITDYNIFKAMSAYNHNWVEGYFNPDETEYLWVKKEEDSILFNEPVYENEKVIPETLCEFTGFSDTYGYKIFDNDKITVFTTDCSFPLNDAVVFKNEEDNNWCYKHTHIFLGKKKVIIEPLNSAKYIRTTGNKFD